MKNFVQKTLGFLALLPLLLAGAETEPTLTDWQAPTPVFKQEFDWLKIVSGEWLKGDIISMYDESLEFDSEELDTLNFDWDDVIELRSKDRLSARFVDGTIIDGLLVVKDGKLTIFNNGSSETYKLAELVSIASSGINEKDLWDGYADLGINFRRGNTTQLDYTFAAGVQRRSSTTRFKTDFTANFSESEVTNPDESTEDVVTADSQRLTSIYDWFFSQKIFLRAADFEYFSDEFVNTTYRISLGVALGYHLIDQSKMSWDITAGPSYQTTQFTEVLAGEDNIENSGVLALGTTFEYEVSSNIDYDAEYQLQVVSEESGEYIHHFQTGFDIDFGGDLDLNVIFYLDRIDAPKADEFNNIPEKNDYRLVVSFGYDF